MTPSSLPRHIAIIMDGNGRWAEKRLLPRYAGHKAGLEAARRTVSRCAELGVEVLTLFAFSSENWRRPEQEVSFLMQLFMTALKREVKKLLENRVRFHVIGDRSAFSLVLQEHIATAEKLTEHNSGLRLVIAANYGGQWDIVEAAKKLASQVEQGLLRSSDIDKNLFAAQLCLADFPVPDLFIRTGGEKRVSNFLLWQLAYTEMYFTDLLWPDFDQAVLQQAIDSFALRQRRFGRTGDQVEQDA